MITVFIADDHAIVRQGLRQILSDVKDMLLVDEAHDGMEALKKVLRNSYDIVLLDISMPKKDGIDVLKFIKNQKPKLPVLILSVHPEDQYAVRALRAGASGYLTKNVPPAELVLAIRKIVRGGKYVSPALSEKLVYELTPCERPAHEELSDREYQVMCLFAVGKSVKDTAEELSLSVSTVSTYKSRILEKMHMKTMAEIIRYAVEHRLLE